MNKLKYTLLFTMVNIFIYSCHKTTTNNNNNNSSSEKDNNNCIYEIYFDKQFLKNTDAIVKNKEIENCYLDIKNGKSDVKGKTKSLKYDFFEFKFIEACGLMRIYEEDNKLKFIRVTKYNIEDNAIYFFGDYDGDTLNFVIFKNFYTAKQLNKIHYISSTLAFDYYIDELLK